MRKTVLIVMMLFLAPMPYVDAEENTIHLWSEQAPGPVLLWDDSGNLTNIDPNQPLDIHLPIGNWSLVKVVDGIPQDNPLLFSSNTNASSYLDQIIQNPRNVSGNAHLNLLGPIEQSEILNATWSSSIVIPNTLGHPDLPYSHLGINHQLSNIFGGDTILFTDWISNHTEIGCCSYDKVSLEGNVNITVQIGNDSWGWSTEANLTGQADSRSTRLLWIPITGNLSDSTDLRITMPTPHEIRYSPQSDYITGLPDDFVIHRGDIEVSGNATIALGTNMQPSVSWVSEDRLLPWIPYTQPTTIESTCTDSSIVSPQSRFILRQGNATLQDEYSDNITIDATFLNLDYSTWVNLTLECTDPQGLVANQSQDLYIDGVQPTRNLQMEYMHGDDEAPVTVDFGQPTIFIPSGAVLSGAVQAGDDSAHPVDIQWTSNKSNGWIQLGIGNHAWNDMFVQGPHINGQNLPIEERHQAKPLSMYTLELELIDAAGNRATQTWDVVVTDRTAPNPRPALSVDGNHYGDLNHPIEGGPRVDVNLEESWDDIDSIEQLTWTVDLNGDSLDVGSVWGDVESFTLPDLPTGRHVLVVNATDSSGNMGSHSMLFEVEPPIGAYIEVIDVVKLGSGGPGEPGALDITLENSGQGESLFRLCYIQDCTSEFIAVQATVDGPGTMTHRLSVNEWAQGDIIVRVEFSDNTSQEFETNLSINSEMTPLMWMLLILPPLIGFIALWRLKKQTNEDDS
ncbi:MAG: hypothetical protein VYA86_02610 [Candidatus Thermoplasmatota archaeon]|nr:hypothetical protein [Candidatus Thermoplasmatota archaeon]